MPLPKLAVELKDTGNGGVESLRQALRSALQWPMPADKDPGLIVRMLQDALAPKDDGTGMFPGAMGMAFKVGKPFIGNIPKSGVAPAVKHELGYIVGKPDQHHGDLIEKYIRELGNIPLERNPTSDDVYKVWRKLHDADSRYNDNNVGFITSDSEFLTRKELVERSNKFRQDMIKNDPNIIR